MATVLLSAAGSAVGSSIGGSILGVGAASIGQALGAVAGGVLDQKLLGSGGKTSQIGRASNLRIQGSTEGTPIPLVYGSMRIAGQIIWSTKFKENIRNSSRGSKSNSGQSVQEFSYTISFAIGIGEGPIDRVGRVWADGKLMTLDKVNFRLYLGDEDQQPDPKIQAVEGTDNVPGYRGVAYIVFEDFPIGNFGNRIPQLNFEVFRSPVPIKFKFNPEEQPARLKDCIRAVSMSPGTGEFSLHNKPIQYRIPGHPNRFANVNNSFGKPDFIVALDQLQEELPKCKAISLVVSWFGDDLRAKYCKIEPRIEERNRLSTPEAWLSSGMTTSTARLISRDHDGRPNFGGSPSDQSIISAIQEMKARGFRVMLYPFLLMDIPSNNILPNPYKPEANQPAFPWRGRITLERAPNTPNTSDQTLEAEIDIKNFFGEATASDFLIEGNNVKYLGPNEWSWRRFVIHLANLARVAGGIDSFCIGTEFRGLTTIRSSRQKFPAVQEFIKLSQEVNSIIPGTEIGYAADWSEYFGYHPNDGSGDILFHLDELWSNDAISFVGIDDYTPMSDWRHGEFNIDSSEGYESPYSLKYLRNNIEGGEYYDFYYGSDYDRLIQNRTAITDSYLNKDWVFRPKDFRGWWSNHHYNRLNGIEDSNPTNWKPMSKPIHLTEIGCPAVDLGSNQPNLFFDERSSEGSLPVGSDGQSDEEIQRRFIQEKLKYWENYNNNPISEIYKKSMIDVNNSYVWTWDARPWPDFPMRESVWADGVAHRYGHWICGRTTSNALSEIILEILNRSGLFNVDVSALFGFLKGYIIQSNQTARSVIEELSLIFDFKILDREGVLYISNHHQKEFVHRINDGDMVCVESTSKETLRNIPISVSANAELTCLQSGADYKTSSFKSSSFDSENEEMVRIDVNAILETKEIYEILDKFVRNALDIREEILISVPISSIKYEPGDKVLFKKNNRTFYIKSQLNSQFLQYEMLSAYSKTIIKGEEIEFEFEPERKFLSGDVKLVLIQLRNMNLGQNSASVWVAAAADPWPGRIKVSRIDHDEEDTFVGSLNTPAQIGVLREKLLASRRNVISGKSISIELWNARAFNQSKLSFLEGRNKVAIERRDGSWEVCFFQFAQIEMNVNLILTNIIRNVADPGLYEGYVHEAGAKVILIEERRLVEILLNNIGLKENIDIRLRVNDQDSYDSIESKVSTAIRRNLMDLLPPGNLRIHPIHKSSDLKIKWNRMGVECFEEWDNFESNILETKEDYCLELCSIEGAVIRREAVKGRSYVYRINDQQEDKISKEFLVRVAQYDYKGVIGSFSEKYYGK